MISAFQRVIPEDGTGLMAAKAQVSPMIQCRVLVLFCIDSGLACDYQRVAMDVLKLSAAGERKRR